MEFTIIFGVLFLIFSMRYNWWRIPISYRYPRILMYHKIDTHTNDRKRNKWRVIVNDFEAQMAWFHKNNWHSFTMSELIAAQNVLPKKSFVVTFDDGYEDNYTNALPILKKYNIKATIYLVPEQIHNHWENFKYKDFDKLLSQKHIHTMLKSGLIEFGSHTTDHYNLTRIDNDKAQYQIQKSKEMVENITHQPCNAFAYPYGKYNDGLLTYVQQAAYTNAVTVQRGVFKPNDDPFAIKRIGILGTESFFDFYLKISRIRNKL